MPTFGVIHYRVPGTLEQFLDFARQAGYGAVELSIADFGDIHAPDADRRAEAIARMVSDRGLVISAVSAGNDFNVLDDAEVTAQVRRMYTVCRLARLAGARVIRTEGGTPKAAVPPDRWVDAIAGCLRRCLDIIEHDGTVLAVDNHGLITNEAGIQTAIFEAVGSHHVGANVDFMNYRWFGHDVATVVDLVREVAPFAKHTHVKDGVGSRQEYQGRALGQGEIPLDECVALLQAAGYRGVWCAEYEGPEVEGGVGYRKCLDWMKAHIRDEA